MILAGLHKRRGCDRPNRQDQLRGRQRNYEEVFFPFFIFILKNNEHKSSFLDSLQTYGCPFMELSTSCNERKRRAFLRSEALRFEGSEGAWVLGRWGSFRKHACCFCWTMESRQGHLSWKYNCIKCTLGNVNS